MSVRTRELTADELWNACDPALFDFETTESLPADVLIIGQERAVRAIDFGVGIASFGFNIFALGYTGTGRTTTIRTFLDRVSLQQGVPSDLIYVHNFRDPNQPRAIFLPSGLAAELRHDMQEMVDDLQRDIPRAFESQEYEKQRESLVREAQEQSSGVITRLEKEVSSQGFALLKTAMGLGVAPVLNGQVLTPEAYQRLDEGTREQIEERQQALQASMAEAMRALRDVEKSTKKRLQEFDRQIADSAVGHLIEELQRKHGGLEEVPDYLAEVREDVVRSVEGFKAEEEPAEGLSAAMQVSQKEALLRRYLVNVVVDNSNQRGAPVVYEPNPTYANLLGRIEHRAEFGALVTDFTMIKAGALHRANGGYLVVEMQNLMANPLAWDALKRSIKNRQIRTEEVGIQAQLVSTVTLEPEPIPLDVKVVLIGDPASYYLLHTYDEDFRKLFKVQAEFGTDYSRTPEACRSYAHFIAARCHQEGLLPFTREAVARVVEHGSRLAEHQNRLASRFGEIADLVREANYWALREGRAATTASDVQRAIEEKVHRSNRADERMQEMIDDGSIRVAVDGEAVGQVNGLSVLSMGDFSFGKPSRITVSTFTGKAGIVSLAREAKMSGRFYDKGNLTLTGYVGGRYARDSQLSMSASISFEQLYDEIEGDSASSAELYALLSSLSGLALKQSIAVTGSVDQAGNVQPVGGVNEKIEGFFSTCRRRGLTGTQGVIMPALNVPNLMLGHEVREAVAQGRFHIYPVETIDEGIEILTNVPAGELRDDGSFSPGSVHARVRARLNEIAQNLEGKEEDEEPGAVPSAAASETEGDPQGGTAAPSGASG